MPSGRGPANQPARTSPGRLGLPAPAFVVEAANTNIAEELKTADGGNRI